MILQVSTPLQSPLLFVLILHLTKEMDGFVDISIDDGWYIFPDFSSPRLLVVLLGLACIKVRLNIYLLRLVFDGGIAIESIER